MDNQNNQQQNGYTNFNGYQPTATPDPNAAPQQQPFNAVPNQQPNYQYQQMPYNPYQVPVQQQSNHKSLVLGILAIVLPIISCTYLSPVGFILGLIGVIRNKKSAVSWVGLVISILLFMFLCFAIYLALHPDNYKSLLQMSGQYSDAEIDELLGQLYGFITARF